MNPTCEKIPLVSKIAYSGPLWSFSG